MPRAIRIGGGPILHAGLCPSLGDNLNGATLVKAPPALAAPAPWLLYFAHHKGDHIRLALAERAEGPWRIHAGGAIRLAETPFAQTRPAVPQPDWAVAAGTDGLYPHIASPEVVVGEDGALTMYLHGLMRDGTQASIAARSGDGLTWRIGRRIVARDTYLRVFDRGAVRHAIAVGGAVLRDKGDGMFAATGAVLDPLMRHAAILPWNGRLLIAWTRVGDAPERILAGWLDPRRPVTEWRIEDEAPLLSPETAWEGAGSPLRRSRPGAAERHEHALRDPHLVADGSRVLMVYSGGGEDAIGLAEVTGL